jgi:ubiquinone biosynthesis protein Coq4
MNPTNWSQDEARCFLEGMKAVATVRGTRPLEPIAEEMLDAVRRHVLHSSLDLATLRDCTPEQCAASIEDPERRREFVQFLVLMPYLDMEVDAAQVEVVDEIARRLEIETDTLTDLHRVRDDRLKRLLLDYSRRSFSQYIEVEGGWAKLKAVAQVLRQFVGDQKVAKRYQALETFPEGSLGHTFFHFYRARNFPLPGEKKSFSELLITHDSCHILGGFNTDMNGEMNVAGFEAGLFDNGFGFELLLEVILDFHLGKTFTTAGLLPPGTGHFDPEDVMVGYERGQACTVNLIKGWDFWEAAHESVTDLRTRYGIPPISGPLLLPPPAAMDAVPNHEHSG